MLERAGNWNELHRLTTVLPHGEALARVYLGLSKHYEVTAEDGIGYRKALVFARKAVKSSAPGSCMWTLAQGQVAAHSADLGLYQEAETAAIAFLNNVGKYPVLAPNTPLILFGYGRSLQWRGRTRQAIAVLRKANTLAVGELAERIGINIVLCLTELGRIGEAIRELPRSNYLSTGYTTAARAIICAHVGDWDQAVELAQEALTESTLWPVYDTIQVAELDTLMMIACQHAGLRLQALKWRCVILSTLGTWNIRLASSLLRTIKPKGGEWLGEACTRCAPAGHSRCGLRGVVG